MYMKKVFIDPGHNFSGQDTGATGYGLKEQDITFKIASKLKKVLEGLGVCVMMSRDSITDNVGYGTLSSSLFRRAEMANIWGADIFVSIHCNAGGGTGTETFTKGTEASNALAEEIQNGVVKAIRLADRGVKDGSHLAVLRKSSMPAVLVETAFIDHASDSVVLASSLGQDAFAEGIARGICEYLDIEGGLTMSQYETLKSLIENLSSKVNDVAADVKVLKNPMIYNYIDDNMPDWAKPTIEKLVNKGFLKGGDDGLNLTEDLMRILVINDRAGIYD